MALFPIPVSERRALQIAILMFGLIPVLAGLAGVLLGAAMMDNGVVTLRLDSHFRYLSGTLLGIGLAFWSLVPRIQDQGSAFRLLTAIVFAGGLGRLLGMIEHGIPNPIMLGALVMELVVTPLLCLWQARVSLYR